MIKSNTISAFLPVYFTVFSFTSFSHCSVKNSLCCAETHPCVSQRWRSEGFLKNHCGITSLRCQLVHQQCWLLQPSDCSQLGCFIILLIYDLYRNIINFNYTFVVCTYTGSSEAVVNAAKNTEKSRPCGVTTEADSNNTTAHPQDGKPRPYLCTVCDKRFTQKGHLKHHSERHTANTVHICSQCEKSFSSRCKLRRHMNIHASKYQCSECGRCFDNSSNLAVHRRSHSGEKPFECSVCNKRFTSNHLVSHSRIHTGEKPYKCHVCDKAFNWSGNLNTHMRVHTGEKPYKCSLCDKSFSRSSNLQMHKFFVHSNRRSY